MKVLKISEEIHEKLKEHLKDTGIFMQSYVEYFLNKAIEKGIVYAMKDKIEDFQPYIHTQELKLQKGKRTLLKSVEVKKNNPQVFYVQPKDPIVFDEYLNNLTKYNNLTEENLCTLYFNLPGYHNVTHPKIEPEDKQGVIKYMSRSKVTGFPVFKLLKNIPEKLETQINKNIDGEFQLSVECTIEEANAFNTLEQHLTFGLDSTGMTRDGGDDGFKAKTGLQMVSEKIDLPKREEFDLKQFKLELVSYIKDNSKYCDDNPTLKRLVFEENDTGARKIISKIMSLSHLIATNSRFGAGTHCIVPSWLTKNINNVNDLSFGLKAFDDKHFDKETKVLNPIGSTAGIVFFESDLVKDVYVYRACENTFKICYNFDKCDVNEINSLLIDDSEHSIYKIKVLKEFDSRTINDWIEYMLKRYPFIEVDGTYSPYNLEPSSMSMELENSKEHDRYRKMTGIDVQANAETLLTHQMFQDLMIEVINPNTDKTHEFKIYGNESFTDLIKMVDDMLEKYARTESTAIVTNGRVASFLSDFSGYNIHSIDTHQSYGLLYPVGEYKGRTIYVDPFMKYNDDRILFMNDVQLKHGKDGILISAYKNDENIMLTTAYKILKDIVVVKVIDNENRMM